MACAGGTRATWAQRHQVLRSCQLRTRALPCRVLIVLILQLQDRRTHQALVGGRGGVLAAAARQQLLRESVYVLLQAKAIMTSTLLCLRRVRHNALCV